MVEKHPRDEARAMTPSWVRFEHRSKPLLPIHRFVRRMLRFLLVGALIDVLALTVGAIGFHVTVGLGWLNAFVDASMVMTGNGPRNPVHGNAGRVFLLVYAIAGGSTYIIVVALVLTPALHRLLHVLHLHAPREPTSSVSNAAVREDE